jgi:hypothetical protein
MQADKRNLVTFASLINSQSGTLPPLFSRAAQLLKLQQQIRKELTPPLSEHLYVANLSNRIMTLYTDSPAWAAKLRYNISTILDIARTKCDLSELRSIRIRVVLPKTGFTDKKRKIELSDQSKQLILNTAESAKDPCLKSALLRLSKN